MIALSAGLLVALLPPLADRALDIAFGPGPLWRYNRGLSVAVLLIWPASLLLARRDAWRVLAALWLATPIVVFSLVSDSAKLALLTGLIAAALVWRAPRLGPALLAVLAVAYIAVAPLAHRKGALPLAGPVALEGAAAEASPLPFTGRHRLLIWQFAAARIAEKPLLGWGFDAARRLPGGHELVGAGAQAMPLHPHNAVLQLWLDLGAGGAALAAVLVAWCALRLRRVADRAASAAAAGYLAAAGTLLCLAFGVWQSWWLAALFLSSALLVAALARDG